jgi:hypothetical protein
MAGQLGWLRDFGRGPLGRRAVEGGQPARPFAVYPCGGAVANVS